jgi:hypothetical protein
MPALAPLWSPIPGRNEGTRFWGESQRRKDDRSRGGRFPTDSKRAIMGECVRQADEGGVFPYDRSAEEIPRQSREPETPGAAPHEIPSPARYSATERSRSIRSGNRPGRRAASNPAGRPRRGHPAGGVGTVRGVESQGAAGDPRPQRSAWRRRSGRISANSPSPASANRRRGRRSASREGRPAAATAKSSRWRTSTCT